MKKINLMLIVFVIAFKAGGTNYYLSASGSDSNLGTSPGSAWQSIAKLNTVIYVPGDTVFFKRSEVFPGDIIVNQGGTSSSSLVFTSYGAGDLPVVIGSEDLTGWTASGNYYTASYMGAVNNFFVNGVEQTLARYPNEHVYLTLDSAQTGYLRDASLASLNSNLITGSKVCVHSSQWSWEKASVASFAGDQIMYGSVMLRPNEGYGYFLYDNITHLDTANEWIYDATAHVLYYYPPAGVDPNAKTCSASVYQNGMELGINVSYVSIRNLGFENQSNSGIEIGYGSNRYITVDYCYFDGQYNHGVNVKGKYCIVRNSYFTHIDGIAVFVNGSGTSSTVDYNFFRTNGLTRTNGLGGQLNGTALMCMTDSNYFHHNHIDSSGYCGISADGKGNLVERNIVDHSMLIENDGGGIKGSGTGTTQSVYRNNFISHGDGNTEGTYQPDFITPALYFDFNVHNCVLSNNTVSKHNQKGIFQNSSNRNNTISGNVIYGGSYLLDLNGTNLAPSAVPITGMTIKHNSFFSKDSNSVIVRQVDYTGNFNTGILDSNYYFQPYNLNRYAMRINGTSPAYYSFSSWQGTGNDPHTVSSFESWTYPASYDTLIMNQTDNAVSVNLGSNAFLDLDSNDVCGNIILQPYTSQILINTNISCVTGIAENNNSNPIAVYPNPAVDEIRIIVNVALPVSTYRIMDVYGRIVLAGSMDPDKDHIRIKDLSPGVYFILLNKDKTYRLKIIKE